MNSLQRNSLAAARVLVALIFLANGFGIIPQAAPMKDLADHGTPATLLPLLILAGRTIQIVAGLALLVGVYPQIAALLLITFLVPATLIAHDFWRAVGTPVYVSQLLQFLKNTAITGGLLFMAATANQPALFPRISRSEIVEESSTGVSARRTKLLSVSCGGGNCAIAAWPFVSNCRPADSYRTCPTGWQVVASDSKRETKWHESCNYSRRRS